MHHEESTEDCLAFEEEARPGGASRRLLADTGRGEGAAVGCCHARQVFDMRCAVSMYPTGGVDYGGTSVTVYGSNFPGGGSDEYACRFGSAVHAWSVVPATLGVATADGSWGRAAARLVCVSPPTDAHGIMR